jgi:ATP-dependent DNA ligase
MIFYYPNRPFLFSPDCPHINEKSKDKNWHAEVKLNGDRLCLFFENGVFTFKNRQNEVFKRYVPPQTLLDELRSFNLPDKTQLDGELLHFHTKNIKHKIVFYDVYTYGGIKQTKTLKERRDILLSHFNKPHKHLAIIEAFYGKQIKFIDLFNQVIQKEECEGLVIKDDRGLIVWDSIKSPDVTWQIKIRRPSTNYRF